MDDIERSVPVEPTNVSSLAGPAAQTEAAFARAEERTPGVYAPRQPVENRGLLMGGPTNLRETVIPRRCGRVPNGEKAILVREFIVEPGRQGWLLVRKCLNCGKHVFEDHHECEEAQKTDAGEQ